MLPCGRQTRQTLQKYTGKAVHFVDLVVEVEGVFEGEGGGALPNILATERAHFVFTRGPRAFV